MASQQSSRVALQDVRSLKVIARELTLIVIQVQTEQTKPRTPKPTRHTHRRSLSTSEHLHFAGKAPPQLSAAAFQPGDVDGEEEKAVEHNRGKQGNRLPHRETDEMSANSVVEHPIEEDQDDSSSSLYSPRHVAALESSPTLHRVLANKGPLSRVVSQDTSSPTKTRGARIGMNSPRYRPRRSSAPDLESIVEQGAEREDEAKERPDPGTPMSHPEVLSNSQRIRRHNRQLSAPVIGGIVDGEETTLVNGSELRLPDGIVITRSGLSSNPTTPECAAGSRPSGTPNSPNGGDLLLETPRSKPQQATPRLGPGLFNPQDLETLGYIGRGTAGVVTKCLHVTALRIVAVKAVQKFDATKRESTVAEIRALHKRMIAFTDTRGEDSSSIVGFFDAFLPSSGGSVNLVLEWMDGGSLEDLVERKKKEGKQLPEDFISVACRRMLKGLCELSEERLLHRDMKPANVLCSRSGAVKLSDFGVSIAFGLGDLSNARTFVGSLGYMAPERVHSSGYSYASDLWGVGIIAYVCATGKMPFESEFGKDGFWGVVQAVEEEVPQLDSNSYSPELIDFVDQCLKRDPTERPTAQDHLNHPFVTRFSQDPEGARAAVAAQLEPVDQEAAREELHRLLKIAADAQLRNGHSFSVFTQSRVRGLADQLGIVLEDPKELEALVDQLNSRLLDSISSPQSKSSPLSVHSSSRASYSPDSTQPSRNPIWKQEHLKLPLDATM